MRKYKLIILEAIVAMILLCTSVYAAINVNLSFRVTNRELKPGEEFKVRLTLNQIELENNKGITDIEGYINYNDDVIEEITAESITKNADGKVVIGEQVLDFEDLTDLDPDKISSNLEGVVVFNGKPASGNDSKVIIGLKEPITTATQVLEVTFKIKEDAKPGVVEDAVEYKLFEVAAGEEKTETISQVIPVTVLGESDETDNTVNNTTNNTVKNEVKNEIKNEVKNEVKNQVKNEVKNEVKNQVKNEVKYNTTKNTVKNTAKNTVTNSNTNKTNTNVDNTVASSTLPKTGASIIIVPIAGLIVVAYVAYNRYMKYKDVD